jgi:hypothetical protein
MRAAMTNVDSNHWQRALRGQDEVRGQAQQGVATDLAAAPAAREQALLAAALFRAPEVAHGSRFLALNPAVAGGGFGPGLHGLEGSLESLHRRYASAQGELQPLQSQGLARRLERQSERMSMVADSIEKHLESGTLSPRLQSALKERLEGIQGFLKQLAQLLGQSPEAARPALPEMPAQVRPAPAEPPVLVTPAVPELPVLVRPAPAEPPVLTRPPIQVEQPIVARPEPPVLTPPPVQVEQPIVARPEPPVTTRPPIQAEPPLEVTPVAPEAGPRELDAAMRRLVEGGSAQDVSKLIQGLDPAQLRALDPGLALQAADMLVKADSRHWGKETASSMGRRVTRDFTPAVHAGALQQLISASEPGTIARFLTERPEQGFALARTLLPKLGPGKLSQTLHSLGQMRPAGAPNGLALLGEQFKGAESLSALAAFMGEIELLGHGPASQQIASGLPGDKRKQLETELDRVRIALGRRETAKPEPPVLTPPPVQVKQPIVARPEPPVTTRPPIQAGPRPVDLEPPVITPADRLAAVRERLKAALEAGSPGDVAAIVRSDAVKELPSLSSEEVQRLVKLLVKGDSRHWSKQAALARGEMVTMEAEPRQFTGALKDLLKVVPAPIRADVLAANPTIAMPLGRLIDLQPAQIDQIIRQAPPARVEIDATRPGPRPVDLEPPVRAPADRLPALRERLRAALEADSARDVAEIVRGEGVKDLPALSSEDLQRLVKVLVKANSRHWSKEAALARGEMVTLDKPPSDFAGVLRDVLRAIPAPMQADVLAANPTIAVPLGRLIDLQPAQIDQIIRQAP